MELLQWKQARYVTTKRKKQIRAVSAVNLETAITRLYGFLVNVRPKHVQSTAVPMPIRTLPDLATPENVGAYAEWCLNVRNLKARSLVSKLASLSAALKEHPRYKGLDFTWFDDLIKGLVLEPESSLRQRKERKYVSYDILSDLPRRIRERRKAAKLGAEGVARMTHDELLIQWLVILP